MKQFKLDTTNLTVEEEIAELEKAGFKRLHNTYIWERPYTRAEKFQALFLSVLLVIIASILSMVIIGSLISLRIAETDTTLTLTIISVFVGTPIAAGLYIIGIIKIKSAILWESYVVQKLKVGFDRRCRANGVINTPLEIKNYDSTRCFNCRYYKTCDRTHCSYNPKS